MKSEFACVALAIGALMAGAILVSSCQNRPAAYTASECGKRIAQLDDAIGRGDWAKAEDVLESDWTMSVEEFRSKELLRCVLLRLSAARESRTLYFWESALDVVVGVTVSSHAWANSVLKELSNDKEARVRELAVFLQLPGVLSNEFSSDANHLRISVVHSSHDEVIRWLAVRDLSMYQRHYLIETSEDAPFFRAKASIPDVIRTLNRLLQNDSSRVVRVAALDGLSWYRDRRVISREEFVVVLKKCANCGDRVIERRAQSYLRATLPVHEQSETQD